MGIKDIHNVYFIGIGGIGMSALARYFKFVGKNVAGYDKTETPLTKDLVDLGIQVHYDDDLELVSKTYLEVNNTLVVYTPAVPKDHGEFNYFVGHGFQVKKRSEVLGLITKDTFCFAVAGTHGKTTTSCILAHLLKETGTPITAFLGGISEDFNSNFLLEGSEYSVVEADEFDRSFLRLSPNVACITSMDADHLDIYGNSEGLQKSFKEFVGRIKPNGKLFVRNGLALEGTTYGIEDGSDYCIRNIKIDQGSYIFDLESPEANLKSVRFNKPGRHNLLNGLVAYAMAVQAGSSPKSLAAALATFKGVQRRFSYQIQNSDFVFIDDYAHHPTELDAAFQAVSEMHPGKRVLAVFQPHLFSRTRDFVDEFAKSLSNFPSLLLLDIYPAREKPIEGVTSQWLLDKIISPRKKLIEKSDLISEILAQNPDVLITMGAGDIGLEVPKIKNELILSHKKQ
ncbi:MULTISPECIES: UDP-N-acetylmuramate--L-alanine ligase [unclassified Arenibacter]|uniref:UDP-N-acetylmuramate--L-alanine ligase n=1 Tax=unclassified Arenibacter TaxID=2615047 RepID=UPI000E3406A2|nr:MULTISPECIES: UDP-N-acetylmuramate--L-alanine ligase [unclassified Arenibacter]MCM4165027.1 UDP-N-acetylmuramate--L-alanine ligase [Arenibacter sp. A80]RFT55432.1 UDP-N-acetylmuramate--L-alanine ligase [Arenibacter sp. P308M17]